MPQIASEVLPVYIIHWNQPAWCKAAVESILATKEAWVDVTVIDNGQIGGQPLASVLPHGVRIVSAHHNGGYTGGANLALLDWLALPDTPEFVVLGSHDLHVAPTALAGLLRTAEEHPTLGVLGPALVGPFESSGGVWTRRGGYQLPLGSTSGLVERDWVSGCCLLLRRKCVEEVGGFDASLGSYVEDVDFCLRARGMGWKIGVQTSARAWGLGSGSPRASSLIEANTVLVIAKHEGLVAGLQALGRIVYWASRTLVGAAFLWRGRERCAASADFCTRHVLALGLVALHVRALVRNG